MKNPNMDKLGKLHDAVLAGKASPLALLCAMYEDAPKPVKRWLDSRLMEIITVEIPKMALIAQRGAVIRRDAADFQTVESIFQHSMKWAESELPKLKRQMSATVEHSGERCAEVIDSAIGRILCEDQEMNREAYMDVVAHHARLIRALMGLTCLPEERNESDPAA